MTFYCSRQYPSGLHFGETCVRKHRVQMKHTVGYVVQQSPGVDIAYVLDADGQCSWGIAVRRVRYDLKCMR